MKKILLVGFILFLCSCHVYDFKLPLSWALKEGKESTVVVYGSELTSDPIDSWVESVKSWTDNRFPGQVDFINSASAGSNSQWGLNNIAELVIAYDPDCVFIEFGIHDAFTTSGITVAEFKSNLISMIYEIRNKVSRVEEIVLLTMNPCTGAPAADRPNLSLYYQAVVEVASEENNIGLIDCFTEWNGLPPATFANYVPDGIHPTRAGYDFLFLPLFRSYLGL